MATGKIVVASDLHGPEQCKETVQALFSFTEKYKPDKRIFLGDLFDLSPLNAKSTPAEKELSIEADIEAGLKFLNDWKPDVFLLGNHDKYLIDAYSKPGNEMIRDLLRGYVNRIDSVCSRLGIEVIEHDKGKCYELAGACYIHGFAASKHTAHKHGQHYLNPVSGHVHKFQAYPSERIGAPGLSWTCGCLCKESLSYDKKMLGTVSHESGWLFGIFNEKAGWTELYPVRRSTGFATILDVV